MSSDYTGVERRSTPRARPANARTPAFGLPRLAWPGWRHLPREARDTLFLLAVIGWTVLPHTAHLPFWCSALTVTMLLWRGALALKSAALPGRRTVEKVSTKVAKFSSARSRPSSIRSRSTG